MLRIIDSPLPLRVAVLAFVLFLGGGFSVLAQVNLWVQDGGGKLPSAEQVLHKYNGVPDSSRMHVILSLDLPEDDPLAMWPYLGATDAEIDAGRKAVLAWVDAGAPEAEFAPLRDKYFANVENCASCHAEGGEMEELPLETYEQVLPFTKQDEGKAWSTLLISAHNHAFGFAILAFVMSILLCMTRLRARYSVPLILGLFIGPALDIGGWLLTKTVGAPWQYAVIAGGGLMGTCLLLAILVCVADALRLFRGRSASEA